MTTLAAVRTHVRQHPWQARVRHYLRTPKGSLLVILALLFIVSSSPASARRVALPLAASVAVVLSVDLPWLRWRRPRVTWPDGGLITALLVVMVISPYERWWVAPVTTAIALVSKHLVRWRGVNLLNPAAIGLLASYVFFDAAHSWWGALTDVPLRSAWPLLLLAGGFIVDRVNRAPLALTFLSVYFALFTGVAAVRAPEAVAEIFVTPDLQAAIFFAAFMLTDPPTSPATRPRQVICGIAAAVTAGAVFVLAGGAEFLLVGLLAGTAAMRLIPARFSRTSTSGNRP